MPVRVHPDASDHSQVVFSNDVSLGGLFLKMTDPLPVGSRVTLVLMGATAHLQLRAEVAHAVRPGAARAFGRPPGVGIKFIEVSPAQRQLLSDLIGRVAGENQHPAAAIARLVPVRAPAPPSPPPPNPERIAELRRTLEQLELRDHCALLGVTPTASATDVRAHYLPLARRWHPERYAAEGPEVQRLVGMIFTLLRTAEETLTDPARRADYLERAGLESDLVPPPAAAGPVTEDRLFGDLPLDEAPADDALDPAAFESCLRDRPAVVSLASGDGRGAEVRLERALEQTRAAGAAGAAEAQDREPPEASPEHPAAVAGLPRLESNRRGLGGLVRRLLGA